MKYLVPLAGIGGAYELGESILEPVQPAIAGHWILVEADVRGELSLEEEQVHGADAVFLAGVLKMMSSTKKAPPHVPGGGG